MKPHCTLDYATVAVLAISVEAVFLSQCIQRAWVKQDIHHAILEGKRSTNGEDDRFPFSIDDDAVRRFVEAGPEGSVREIIGSNLAMSLNSFDYVCQRRREVRAVRMRDTHKRGHLLKESPRGCRCSYRRLCVCGSFQRLPLSHWTLYQVCVRTI